LIASLVLRANRGDIRESAGSVLPMLDSGLTGDIGFTSDSPVIFCKRAMNWARFTENGAPLCDSHFRRIHCSTSSQFEGYPESTTAPRRAVLTFVVASASLVSLACLDFCFLVPTDVRAPKAV